METNVVTFILENIYLFLPLGLAGIIITLALIFTSKKTGAESKDDISTDYYTLYGLKINVYLAAYSIICIIMIITGILSQLYTPIALGGIIAIIPILFVIILQAKGKQLKG
jgi:hypothetical protein